MVCLAIMYLTDLGMRGIRRYDASFKSPDMKFHYSTEQIMETFERIGDTGRMIYGKYLILDCIFTFFLVIVMFTITNSLITTTAVRYFMFVICVLRAAFDLLENSILMKLMKRYPFFRKSMIRWCSWFTSIKFLLLYIWIIICILKVQR